MIIKGKVHSLCSYLRIEDYRIQKLFEHEEKKAEQKYQTPQTELQVSSNVDGKIHAKPLTDKQIFQPSVRRSQRITNKNSKQESETIEEADIDEIFQIRLEIYDETNIRYCKEVFLFFFLNVHVVIEPEVRTTVYTRLSVKFYGSKNFSLKWSIDHQAPPAQPSSNI